MILVRIMALELFSRVVFIIIYEASEFLSSKNIPASSSITIGELLISLLTTELSQLIAEQDSDQLFTTERFLRENREDVRSIMSKLDLVPSRHETILKMAGIIGSGVFAGLSLLVPGLSFAGFSLYGFSPMIKHLGQRVLSPKAGTTTKMRAAISNARQDMVAKGTDVKIDKLSGVKKGLGQDAELKSRFDRSPAFISIYQISSSGQAVEYLVDSKYYGPITSAVTYAPAQSVANLEAQMGLLKNQREIFELVNMYQTKLSAQLDKVNNLKSSAVSLQAEPSEEITTMDVKTIVF